MGSQTSEDQVLVCLGQAVVPEEYPMCYRDLVDALYSHLYDLFEVATERRKELDSYDLICLCPEFLIITDLILNRRLLSNLNQETRLKPKQI